MLAVALLLAATAAGPLDGRWSSQAEFCNRPQEDQSAPAIIRGGRFDQHEAHCRWGALKPAGAGAWTAKGQCSVEGDATRGAFRFQRSAKSLSIKTPDGVTTHYRLCPAP